MTTPDGEEEDIVLARLASQHHASEYTRLKGGVVGRYTPLSIESPEVYEQMRRRQEEDWERVTAWWVWDKEEEEEEVAGEEKLAQELEAAMKESLPCRVAKTSQSHPINISFVIPPERIPLLVHSAPAFPAFIYPPALGNLLLSSCPGKKVRLSGPVKGRSTVCRDLQTDLTRIKNMGVACIVCCLDDTELSFLGSPWPEYAQTARSLGIHILRLPTPEGLPPCPSPFTPTHLSTFDTHLIRLIHTYTLRNRHVLVHCRGGVGRAGVLACCWILRLGLLGPLQPGVVHRAVAHVRSRRSLKAIETYEQARFLVDYVAWLRDT